MEMQHFGILHCTDIHSGAPAAFVVFHVVLLSQVPHPTYFTADLPSIIHLTPYSHCFQLTAGGNLFMALRRSPHLFAWDKIGRKIALEVALGLNYLHSRRPPMIHRDIKSPNVLLTKEGVAKIGDVGMMHIQAGQPPPSVFTLHHCSRGTLSAVHAEVAPPANVLGQTGTSVQSTWLPLCDACMSPVLKGRTS